ncbi:uncharacterized protein LOC119638353 [Glossina fuscipes]|uniref:Uncharacterized protein LOC119638353 n=1 Tax=Glossina fuscipes TaxID=7396 RepID=A0A9C5Z318_9MUSC|nr:uncharacterized protein LOC119638353 [Glossina fuscipes]
MMESFNNGIYRKKTKEGRIIKIRLMYDYIHLAKSFFRLMKEGKQFDCNITANLKKRYFENMNKEACEYWINRGVVPTVVHPLDFPEYIAYYADVTPAFIKTAMNTDVIKGPIVERTYKFIKAATRFVNVFRRKTINTSTWPHLKGTLKEAYKYFNKYLTANLLSVETRFTILNFIKIVDKLLRAYPEISIAGYRVSQDIIERFICNMAPTYRKRRRTEHEFEVLVQRLMAKQREYWRQQDGTIGDYDLVETLDYRIQKQAEQEFRPLHLDGAKYKNVTARRRTLQHTRYFRVMTGYAVGKYIRDEVSGML